ncbi:MAG TPA: glutamate-1-semialdehyde 2,1-aminomutase [Terriglobales bacterium]|nr:glutamate-1-semialdehyde 2,1-aminomutase [Terriglobales bacterium]
MSQAKPPLSASRRLQARAEALLPAGVNSPVRAFRAVQGEPRWIARGAGAYLYDVDGSRYVDYIGSWGAMLLGHAHPAVTAAVQAAAAHGTSFGLSSPEELALAERIHEAYPAIEMLRFVNSGTEAVMSVLRLARGYTGRDLILKFAGGYHGHADALLVEAGSGLATFGTASSAGVPAAAVAATIVLPYNDLHAAQAVFDQEGAKIAAVIVEPVAGNMGCIPPVPGFLQGLRALAANAGALLILDEVMTGSRLAYGGATERFQLEADLFTLGKVIGGGLPIGAFGGRAEIMRHISPLGPVYQAGTLSGNPLSMAAGLATLETLRADRPAYQRLEATSTRLAAGLREAARSAGLAVQVQSVGSMFTVFFAEEPVRDFTCANRSDTRAFAAFHRAMTARGVLLPPAQFEAAFVSLAHGDQEVDLTLAAAAEAFRAVGSRA